MAALLPALLLGLSEIFSSYQTERRNLNERLAMSAILSASAVEQFVQAHLSAVSLLADAQSDRADWNTELHRLHSQYPALITALATDNAGRITGSYPSLAGANRFVDDRDYYREPARTGRAYVSNAFTGRGFGTDPLIAVSAPMMDGGRFRGVIEGSIHVDEFTKLRSQALRARGFEMLILDRDHRVIHASAGLPFRFHEDLSGSGLLRGRPWHGRATLSRAKQVLRDGSGAFVAQTSMSWGWTLFLLVPESALHEPLMRRLANFFLVLGVVVAGTLLTEHMVMRRFGASVQRILTTLQALARNDATSKIPMREIPAELLPLAESINHLAGRANTAESSNVELDRLSKTDALTGALNRRGIDAALEGLLDRSTGSTGTVAALAFDIDHFKLFNDSYGHVAGDTALRRVAGAIAGSLRAPGDVLGRSGGEEFVALLPDTDPATAYAVAERARKVVAELDIPHETSPEGRLTTSIGVFVASPGVSARELIEGADQALYRAKSLGRNRVEM